MKAKMCCVICGTELGGRQRQFCSRACKNRDTNKRHQSYAAQNARGILRKRSLINALGGACSQCGYSRSLAALAFHHVNPGDKAFSFDIRSLSNRSWSEVEREAKKCVVLCANCHAELHFPERLALSPSNPTKITNG
ncbi:MAG: hypothetical protein ACX94A_10565 [Algiphilus sp.]